MCGIMASVSGIFDKRLELLKGLELRGRDGFGCYAWDSLEPETITKTLKTASDFLNTLPIHEQVNKIGLNRIVVMGNTRAVPSTEFAIGAGQELKNQQPFTSDRYALVFNGLIANDKALIKEYDLRSSAEVDTAMLIPLFEKVGIVEGMKLLEGAFALIILDKLENTLYFGRNFMPLHYEVIEGGELNIVSLEEMVTTPNFVSVPPYTCFKFDLTTKKFINQFSLYKREQNKKAMIVFSGGMDSVVTAYVYKHLGYDLTLVHFNYGQAAEEVEDFVSKKIAEDLGAELLTYNARNIFEPYKDISKLLYQKEAKVSEQSRDAESTLSYVPNRNATLAMIVAGLAEMKQCDTVAFGGQQMDSVYPDNTPDFVRAVDNVLKFSLNWHTNIKFAAPLVHLMKHEIIQLAIDLKVPLAWVTSCYYPKKEGDRIKVCGNCGCCQVRDATFKMLKVTDPQKQDTGIYAETGAREYIDTKMFILKYVQLFS
jgi:7-cyano-7-deazaguanine synthase